jgi:uncharacterized membrane protein
MTTGYVLIKFFHILIAIIALGTSAGLGIVLEFYGNHPTHGLFVLRAIRRLLVLVVVPGYLLMAATGIWMAYISWSFTIKWIQAALALWIFGMLILPASVVVLHKQISLFEAGGPTTRAYIRVSLLERFLGAMVGLIVVATLYLMVAKPGL